MEPVLRARRTTRCAAQHVGHPAAVHVILPILVWLCLGGWLAAKVIDWRRP